LITFTPPRPRRLLAILAFAPGILAGAAVLATLVLLAVDGHPEGLLAAGFGATVPVMLWWARRQLGLRRSARESRPTTNAELTIRREPTSGVEWPPTRTILYPVALNARFGK
jgi:hypothetical protein